jgi:hypothetical protein
MKNRCKISELLAVKSAGTLKCVRIVDLLVEGCEGHKGMEGMTRAILL